MERATMVKPDVYQASRKASTWEILTNEKYFKWTLLIPLALLLLIFMFYPLFYCIYYSFHEWGMQGDAIFVGLHNYRQMLNDTSFLEAFGRTFEVLVICTLAELVIGLGLALLWNREFRGRISYEDLPSCLCW